MSETVRFQSVRGVDRRRPSKAEKLSLFESPISPGELFGGADDEVVEGATAWRDDPTRFADPLRPGTPRNGQDPDGPAEFAVIVDLLRALDEWLVSEKNAPEVERLEAEAARLARTTAIVDVEGKPCWVVAALVADERWGQAWDCLRRSFCALLAAPRADLEQTSRDAARLQRLLLVAGLVEALGCDIPLRGGEDVRRFLQDRVVIVPSPPFPLVQQRSQSELRRVRLARRAGFGDLWVLREEWSCYQPGEVAHIENVLQGERRKRVHKRVDETETTETSETETTRTDRLDTETTDRFELTEETSRDTSLAIHVDGQIDTSGLYGSTQLDTHIGGSLDWSVDESRRRASEVAHESVERAVHQVEVRVREERIRRTLTRIEETNTHEIDNSDQPIGNVVGLYRWVDKIQRMQLFRFSNRYLLEFQLPEPAAFVRWLQERDTGPDPVTPAPPPFSSDGQPLAEDGSNQLTMSSIDADTYGEFAARYRASVEPPPEEIVWVSGSATIELDEPENVATPPSLALPPTATDSITLVVPDGYAAVAADASAAGVPIHGDWSDHPSSWEGDPRADGWDDRDGYHVIRAEVTIAGTAIPLVDGTVKTVSPATDAALPEYADAWLSRAVPNVKLSARPEREISAGVTIGGAYKGAVSVALKCEPLVSTVEQWRADTFAALLDAHRSWQAQYDSERRAIDAREGVAVEGSSPARNREVIREELKRLIVEQLLGQRFDGVSAVDRYDTPPEMPRVNLDDASKAAPIIQFLEQVFEWDKLTYVLYPYYWADSSQWSALQPVNGADPEFARFLRAGSARVVVAARPGYANAVNHWLWFRQPWGTGAAAAPGEDGYLSIADEIRALNQAPDDGEPDESWEVRLPTTLIWLDPDPSLPKYNHAMRLDEPIDPRARLCRPGDDAPANGAHIDGA